MSHHSLISKSKSLIHFEEKLFELILPCPPQEVEVAIVCPYQMHQRTFSDDFSVISPFLHGGTTHGQDVFFGEEGESNSLTQAVCKLTNDLYDRQV